MAFSSSMIIKFLVVTFFFSSPTDASFTHRSSGSKRHGIITKLIHRDSILSPLYNPNETTADRASRLVEMSDAHVARRFSTKDDNILSTNSLITGLQMGTQLPLFFISFCIHNLTYPQLAILDTGSPQIWLMCSSCLNCRRTLHDKFRPSDSPTYKPVRCRDQMCKDYTPKHQRYIYCDENQSCMYNVAYVYGVNSFGLVGTDNFVFEDYTENDLSTIENVAFGCAKRVEYVLNTRDRAMMGVFGLGQTGNFARRMESFSYCIGFDDMYNRIAFGVESALLKGGKTPFAAGDQENYAAGLKGIKLGTYEIQFATSNALIDSGSTLTYLSPRTFNRLKIKIDSILTQDLKFSRDYSVPDLCYEGSVMELGGFPDVIFSFVGDAKLVVQPYSLFMTRDDDSFCLAIKSTVSVNIGNYSILIGSLLQTDHNMGFDVKAKMIYMYPTLCNRLY